MILNIVCKMSEGDIVVSTLLPVSCHLFIFTINQNITDVAKPEVL